MANTLSDAFIKNIATPGPTVPVPESGQNTRIEHLPTRAIAMGAVSAE